MYIDLGCLQVPNAVGISKQTPKTKIQQQQQQQHKSDVSSFQL